MFDRWVLLAHGPQMCCFSLVWDVLPLSRVFIVEYTYPARLGWIFHVIFIQQANHMRRIILAVALVYMFMFISNE